MLKLIYVLSDLENNMKWATQKNIIFQAGIIRASMPEENNTLEERISKIEQKLKNDRSFSNEGSNKLTKAEDTNKTNIEKKEIVKNMEPIINKTNTVLNKSEVDYWQKVVNTLKQQGKIMLYTNLLNTTAKEINDMTIGIEGLTAFGKPVLEKNENMQEIIRLVSIEAGKEMRIKYLEGKKENLKEEKNNEISDLGININIIDE